MSYESKTMPKILKSILTAGLLVLLCVSVIMRAEAKGLLVKIEHFTPAGFSPGRGESVGIDCYVLKSSVITVRIFSFAGMKVFDQKKGFFDEGKHGFSWDGKEASGAAAQAGFYFIDFVNYINSINYFQKQP